MVAEVKHKTRLYLDQIELHGRNGFILSQPPCKACRMI